MPQVSYVAIVGRPNVGKSTLFNRFAKKRISIVQDTPGVTRDRIYAKVEWNNKIFHVIDTGGFEPVSKDRLLIQIAEQTQLAIEEADIIIFLVDGQEGLTVTDQEVADKLRISGKRIILAVNKIDAPKHDLFKNTFFALGLGEPMAISSEHGVGIEDLLSQITDELPSENVPSLDPSPTEITRISLIGKPNVGKSSLFNALVGEERVLVDEKPGTTRDAIDTVIKYDQKDYLLVDTAGIRRKSRVSQQLEKYSIIMAFKSLERCHVSLILLDGVEGISEQDLTIAGYAHEAGRACIMVINKWDKVENKAKRKETLLEDIRWRFKFLPYAPILFVSALTGDGLNRIFPTIDKVRTEFFKRIATAELNKFLREILGQNPPPSQKGKMVKLQYLTQVSIAPPTFVIFCNNYKGVHFSYMRFLQNKLRDKYGFGGTPLRLHLRERQ